MWSPHSLSSSLWSPLLIILPLFKSCRLLLSTKFPSSSDSLSLKPIHDWINRPLCSSLPHAYLALSLAFPIIAFSTCNSTHPLTFLYIQKNALSKKDAPPTISLNLWLIHSTLRPFRFSKKNAHFILPPLWSRSHQVKLPWQSHTMLSSSSVQVTPHNASFHISTRDHVFILPLLVTLYHHPYPLLVLFFYSCQSKIRWAVYHSPNISVWLAISSLLPLLWGRFLDGNTSCTHGSIGRYGPEAKASIASTA